MHMYIFKFKSIYIRTCVCMYYVHNTMYVTHDSGWKLIDYLNVLCTARW